MKKCPNNKCDGIISVLYKSSFKQNDKINFNCTTDTYEKPQVNICEKCNLMFSDFIYKFDDDNLEQKYSDVEDKKYISEIEFKKKYFLSLYKKIKSYINSDSSVLEIGSYYGVLGNILNKSKLVKKYSGLELSEHAVTFSKNQFNLNVINETIEKHHKKNETYDLIMLADVVEHFRDPFQSFELIEKMLNKNGTVIFTTYDMDSFYPKFKKVNYHWIIPFHLFFFSKKTLSKILEERNLKIVKTINDPRFVSFGYLLEKLSYIFPKFKFIWNFFRDIGFLKKLTIKVNLGDLKIFIVKKMN